MNKELLGMKTTESGQMNQNTELVKRLRESGETLQAGMVLCRQAALTISTQERVIVELREALKEAMEANYHHLEPHERPLAADQDWVVKARAALSKGSGQ